MPINDDGMVEYDIPVEIKHQLSEDFLRNFQNRVVQRFKQNDINQGRSPQLYEHSTYITWWIYMEGSSGFCESFREVCEERGLVEVLSYYDGLPYWDSDIFDDEICQMMIEKGIITEGEDEEYEDVGDGGEG